MKKLGTREKRENREKNVILLFLRIQYRTKRKNAKEGEEAEEMLIGILT